MLGGPAAARQANGAHGEGVSELGDLDFFSHCSREKNQNKYKSYIQKSTASRSENASIDHARSTHAQTDGQVENIMPRRSIEWAAKAQQEYKR